MLPSWCVVCDVISWSCFSGINIVECWIWTGLGLCDSYVSVSTGWRRVGAVKSMLSKCKYHRRRSSSSNRWRCVLVSAFGVWSVNWLSTRGTQPKRAQAPIFKTSGRRPTGCHHSFFERLIWDLSTFEHRTWSDVVLFLSKECIVLSLEECIPFSGTKEASNDRRK